jgi:hypothetical protein
MEVELGRIWKKVVVAHFMVSKQSTEHFSQTNISDLTYKANSCSTAHKT